MAVRPNFRANPRVPAQHPPAAAKPNQNSIESQSDQSLYSKDYFYYSY